MKKLMVSLLVAYPVFAVGQHQDRTLFFYNIGIGGITSGIGAVINKPKHTDWKKHLVKGFWQGSIGGLLNYSGKKSLYLINRKNKVAYGWGAKLLHSAGTAIMENAALNEPFLQNWNVEYGPVRVDFSINGHKKTRVRFLPWFVYSAIAARKVHDIRNEDLKLDLPSSLLSGTITFSGNGLLYANEISAEGYSFGKAIAYSRLPWKNRVIAHELVHVFQFKEYQVLNTWLKPVAGKLPAGRGKTFFDKYIYPDLPYFRLAYALEREQQNRNHYKNFYEFEAQRFATNKYVYR